MLTASRNTAILLPGGCRVGTLGHGPRRWSRGHMAVSATTERFGRPRRSVLKAHHDVVSVVSDCAFLQPSAERASREGSRLTGLPAHAAHEPSGTRTAARERPLL